MGELSGKAKSRLAFIEFNNQVRDVSLTCKVFKISRETFYKWNKRYDPHYLRSLEDKSKAPLTRRKGILTYAEKQTLKAYREKYIRIGKVKLSKMYFNEFQKTFSSWQFQKVIESNNLYYDKIKVKKLKLKKDRNKGAKKVRINTVNPKDYISLDRPFFIAVDTIVLYLPWGKRYIVTALDHFNRLGFARTYCTKSSLFAMDFLLRLNALTEGRIAAILSDNGSEFAKYFEEACKRLNIVHIYTRIRTPKDNPKDERFNRTIKEEFIEVNQFYESYLTDKDLTLANRELTDYLVFYNFKRPHQALAYQTPMEYITNIQRVSGMYPSSTRS